MNTQYDVKEWAARTTRGRQVYNHNYRMLGTELKGWKLLKVVTMQEGSDITEKAYLWQSKTDPEHEMIRVDITERHSWKQAQESLHGHLMESMRPDIPAGTKHLAQLGDVVFAGRSAEADVPAAVTFTRGNVLVSVSSAGEKHVDVSDAAALIDSALSESPAPKEVEKGNVRVLTPKSVTAEAKKASVLIDNLQKTSLREKWVKIIVPDGELGRKGDTLTYTPAAGGKKEVGTFVIGD
jgi:hypothetical protein